MFDVRPVDKTGDLDWKKIQSVGENSGCIGDEPQSTERIYQIQEDDLEWQIPEQIELEANAYVLGQPIESKAFPVFHESEFQERDFCAGDESRDISFENVKSSEVEREEMILARALANKEELKRIAENNRRQYEEYEATVLNEREAREKQHEAWLEKEFIFTVLYKIQHVI